MIRKGRLLPACSLLAQLAHQLGLDPAAVAAIEAETTAKIDAQPETEN